MHLHKTTGMDFKDYYQMLGVDRAATADQIKKAYRVLARKHHPDVNKDPRAPARFSEINEAHEVLSDPAKREKYDKYGAAWDRVQEGAPPPPEYEDLFSRFRSGSRQDTGTSGFSSFFEQLFGEAATGGRSWFFSSSGGPQDVGHAGPWGAQGADAEATISLTLEEAAAGGPRQITINDGWSGRPRSLRVQIPQGLTQGDRIRLAGQGHPGPGTAAAGDLFLVIDLLPHKRFRLDGRDLHCRLPVSPWVAVLGGRVPVQTLSGRLMVKVPPDSVSGKCIRLKGQGYPAAEGGHGDLYMDLEVKVPASVSDEERDLLRQWQSMSDFEPSAQ